jgi:hypothetical protein
MAWILERANIFIYIYIYGNYYYYDFNNDEISPFLLSNFILLLDILAALQRASTFAISIVRFVGQWHHHHLLLLLRINAYKAIP